MSFCCFLIDYTITFRAKYPQTGSFLSLFAHYERTRLSSTKTEQALQVHTKGGQKAPLQARPSRMQPRLCFFVSSHKKSPCLSRAKTQPTPQRQARRQPAKECCVRASREPFRSRQNAEKPPALCSDGSSACLSPPAVSAG